MTDTYQQAHDAMAEHAKLTAQPHDASCRCGACFHAAQDKRMAEASTVRAPMGSMAAEIATLRAELAEAQSAASTWRQCAEARAERLEAAQASIADLRADFAKVREKENEREHEIGHWLLIRAGEIPPPDVERVLLDAADYAAYRQQIADLRAMLAAQQAVIAATPAVSDAIADALLYGHSAVRVTHVDMEETSAFPSRALRGGDGVPR